MPRLSGTRRRADFFLLGSVTADVRFGSKADIREGCVLCPLYPRKRT